MKLRLKITRHCMPKRKFANRLVTLHSERTLSRDLTVSQYNRKFSLTVTINHKAGMNTRLPGYTPEHRITCSNDPRCCSIARVGIPIMKLEYIFLIWYNL